MNLTTYVAFFLVCLCLCYSVVCLVCDKVGQGVDRWIGIRHEAQGHRKKIEANDDEKKRF